MEIFDKLFVAIFLTVYFAAFVIKNITTAKRTKQAIKGSSNKVNLLIFNSTLLYLLAYYSIFFNPAHFFWINLLNLVAIKIIGLLFIVIAFVLGISTLITMKDSWRVGVRPEQKTELIVNGNFIFSRNPYFLSYDLMFLGIFLVFPFSLYMIIYILFLIVVHLMIIDEEKHLLEQHGANYQKYRNSVNRYFSLRFV